MHPETPSEIAAVVLLDIAVIVAVARVFGLLFRRIRQPAVVAEIIAALALGPSLLGSLPGNPTESLFPGDVRPYLSVIAALGLAIFMFIVGLELDLKLIKGKGRVAATISVSSIVLPFAMGVTLALWLHRSHDDNGVDLLPFVLFIGAALSVTAFPVLARILSERGIQRTQVGALALACAAVDDVLAWTMLAGVLAIVKSTGAGDLVLMLAESLAFVAVMFLVVKPLLRRLVNARATAGRLTPNIFSIVLVGILVSSFVTDHIGIHAIFGAFLFGAVMPREGAEQLTKEILERVEQLTVLVLLPVFFIVTGLQVDIGDLGASGLVELAAVLAVAISGKFLGAALAARAARVPTRRAAAVGILMNARGLTELVILSVGKSAGVLDDRLFTIMVLMAILTTVMTEPLLRLVYPEHIVKREIAQAERDALGSAAGYRVVVAIGEDAAEAEVVAGAALLMTEANSQLVISRVAPALESTEVGTGLTFELAAIANSFESMQALSHRAEALGVNVITRSQFSDNAVDEIVAQSSAIDADVIVSGDPSTASALVDLTETTVVMVTTSDRAAVTAPDLLTGATSVTVLPGSSEDGLAAVQQAARLAAGLSLELVLDPTAGRRELKRSTVLLAKLQAAGLRTRITAAVDTASTGQSLLVVGWSDWASKDAALPATAEQYRGLLVVRGATGDANERLTALVRSLSETVIKG